MDKLDLKETLVQPEIEETLVQLELKEKLDAKERTVQPALLVQQLPDLKELMVKQEQMEPLALLVPEATLVMMEIMEKLGLKDPEATLVEKVSLVTLVQ